MRSRPGLPESFNVLVKELQSCVWTRAWHLIKTKTPLLEAGRGRGRRRG